MPEAFPSQQATSDHVVDESGPTSFRDPISLDLEEATQETGEPDLQECVQQSGTGEVPSMLELRERYEKPYRKNYADGVKRYKNWLSEERDKEVSSIESRYDAQVKQLTRYPYSSQLEVRKKIEVLSQDIERLKNEIAGRGRLEQITYVFGRHDPTSEKVDELQKELQQIRELEEQREAEYNVWVAEQVAQLTEQKKQEIAKPLSYWKENHKKLLQDTRGANKSSRDALRNTHALLEEGALDISELAKNENALVVHAAPIPGWLRNRTTGNNAEVDTASMDPDEQLKIIEEINPDLSASVVGIGEHIEGQKLIYPFGFVLDGTLIASYQGDVGTKTHGRFRTQRLPHATLQSDPAQEFKTSAVSPGSTRHGWNECIVNRPKVLGILVDADRIESDETFQTMQVAVDIQEKTPQEIVQLEQEFYEKYKEFNPYIHRVHHDPEPGYWREFLVVDWKQDGVAMAVQYAKTHFSDLPIYVRRKDDLLLLDGTKVTVQQVYTNAPVNTSLNEQLQ